MKRLVNVIYPTTLLAILVMGAAPSLKRAAEPRQFFRSTSGSNDCEASRGGFADRV